MVSSGIDVGGIAVADAATGSTGCGVLVGSSAICSAVVVAIAVAVGSGNPADSVVADVVAERKRPLSSPCPCIR